MYSLTKHWFKISWDGHDCTKSFDFIIFNILCTTCTLLNCWNVHTLSISSWYPPKFCCASLSSLTDSVIQTSSPILTRVVDAILGMSWIILESVTITMILLQAIRSNQIINHNSSVNKIGFACRFVATRLSPEKNYSDYIIGFSEQFTDAIKNFTWIKTTSGIFQ